MHGESMPLDTPKSSQTPEAKQRRVAAAAKIGGANGAASGERRSRGQPKGKR